MTTLPTEIDSVEVSSLPSIISETFSKIEIRLKEEKSDALTDAELLQLYGLFGDTLERAFEILDKSTIKLYKKQVNNRTIIEVPGSNNSVYRFFPDINYCTCQSYLHLVLKSSSQYTCKHILAAKIAILTNKNIQTEILQDFQFNVIIEQITPSSN